MEKKLLSKLFPFAEGKFVIRYYDNSQAVSAFKDDNVIYAIDLNFFPVNGMNYNKVLEFTYKKMPKLEVEINKILVENSEFYEKFEISWDSNFSGSAASRNDLYQLVVSHCRLNFYCSFKVS